MSTYYKRYTKTPRSVAEYSNMRGVTDFTNAAQFNIFESGYAYLFVISRPKYLEMIASNGDKEVEKLLNAFSYILEYEFKGLDGIEDITVDPIEITDGISQMNVIGKVNQQSATEISMTFTEKSGSTITRFMDYYIRGIKDPRSQAKTYHGLISEGGLESGFENEVFNLMYIVTDNTMLNLEKAYLFVNAYPNKATTSIYNVTKGEIDKKEIDVTMQCFVIDGAEVDKRAVKMLSYISEDKSVFNHLSSLEGMAESASLASNVTNAGAGNTVVLDSNNYDYSVFSVQGTTPAGSAVNGNN